MYREEGVAMSYETRPRRMNYEAEPESIDERAAALAARIYSEIYGDVDDKRHKAAKVQQIYEWLTTGDDLAPDPDVEELAAEWREYDETGIEGAPTSAPSWPRPSTR